MIGVSRQQLISLIHTTLVDLPDVVFPDIDFKKLFELYGHPIVILIKSGQKVPVGLRIYYNIPASWVLEWKRKWQ